MFCLVFKELIIAQKRLLYVSTFQKQCQHVFNLLFAADLHQRRLIIYHVINYRSITFSIFFSFYFLIKLYTLLILFCLEIYII